VSKRERNIDQQIRNWLKHRPDLMGKKLHGSMFSLNESDWIFCVLGRTVIIEMKVPGKEARKGQELRQREWQVAGARVAVCDNIQNVQEIITEEETRMRRLLEYEAAGYI
jgi:hypothetical protein